MYGFFKEAVQGFEEIVVYTLLIVVYRSCRNVFSWKGTSASSQTQGWKIFSRSIPQESNENGLGTIPSIDALHGVRSRVIGGDCESIGSLTRESLQSERSLTDSPLSGKKYEDVVASSSALILHNRPANLPAKSVDEEQKHRLEYQQIVEAAKRKGSSERPGPNED